MLGIKYIRENREEVKQATAAKQMDSSVVDDVLELVRGTGARIGGVEQHVVRRIRCPTTVDVDDSALGRQHVENGVRRILAAEVVPQHVQGGFGDDRE